MFRKDGAAVVIDRLSRTDARGLSVDSSHDTVGYRPFGCRIGRDHAVRERQCPRKGCDPAPVIGLVVMIAWKASGARCA
jgi:hypothetical protein